MLTRPPRVLSYGGGADSFAILLRAIETGDKPDVVTFVDVADGTPTTDPVDPGEWPGTYKHIREIVIPLCEAAGIRFEWIDTARFPVRNARSLFAWLWARGQIPVAGPNRLCTIIAKVERFERWATATFPGQRVEVWIGFEAGEEDRAAKDPNAGKPSAWRTNRYPLIEWSWCRCRAVRYIRSRGYAVPRKSACMGCCYNSMTDWQTLQREKPEVFAAYAELEARKPETSNGVKMSIAGFHMLRTIPKRSRLPVLVDGRGKSYQAPPLPLYVEGKAIGSRTPCLVCGAAQRATKEVGCGYLDDGLDGVRRVLRSSA